MKYYTVVVAYLVQADDEETAQQKADADEAVLTSVLDVDDVTAKVEPIIAKMHHPQPEKGLW